MEKLLVLYDGKCHVCYREIKHYLKKDTKGLLVATDINSKEFDATKYGLTKEKVHFHLHSIDESSRVYVGVATFIEIWKRVEGFQFLVPIFENKLLRPAFDFSYHVFAQYIRPYLPKRKNQKELCSFD